MASLLYTKEAQARTILCGFRHKKTSFISK